MIGPARAALLASTLFLAATAANASAQMVQDSQLWVGAQGRVEVNRPLTLEVEQELRVGANAGFDKTYTQVAAKYDVTSYLRAGLGYRFIITEPPGAMATESRNRVALDIEPHAHLKRIKLSYRLRLQVKSRPNETDTYWRNRFKASVEATKQLEPFAAIEFHTILSPKNEYRETRLYLGTNWAVTSRFEVEAFYAYQQETNVAMPEQNHILGIEGTYTFRKAPKAHGRDKADVSK